MPDLFDNIVLGFTVAASFKNLGLCFLGCLIGTLIGVLPGVGPVATISMLLPITFGIDPIGALIMLAGIYYGAQYGGSTTAILVNIPGEATAVVTALDGHQMARQGRAGVALGMAAIGSFIAGTFATIFIALLAVPLTRFALLFKPADYFALMVLGLTLAVVLARGSLPKAIAMIVLGVLLSTVGRDLVTGDERLTFGWNEIDDGIDFAVVAMGVFGFAEILRNLDTPEARSVVHAKIGRLLPGREDFRKSAGPITRGTLIGSFLGLLPGNGAVLAPFATYTIEKKIAADPTRFGKGAIEGVAGPEAANNAGAQTAFIPLLTLGVPPNAGARGDDQAAQALLGHDRLHVDRESHVARHQPADGRPLGAAAEGALPAALPDDRPVLLHRHLLGGEQPAGRLPDGSVRPCRLHPHQARLRAGAAAAGIRPRAAPRGKAPAGDRDLPGQLLDIHRAQACGRHAGDYDPRPDPRHSAGHAQKSRECVRGMNCKSRRP
jgi:TctA family transporter